ncbi:DUF1616 domain-containing protein [Candidatus Bathyarchaeota archaeon A05DMB-2]|jgi:uncharacterized membrane protein|nr:DUF1616 domain-containing protein [Candidatus Bathyarchaeota archaeon A05DMB-2]
MEKLNENKGYMIAIVVVLVFVSSLVTGYYIITRLPPEGYSTINLLDYQQKKAIDYPELLIINHNNTFNVYVEVENHMGTSRLCEVQLKITNETITILPVPIDPVNTFTETVENGENWETLATVSVNQPGNYSVVFELWLFDDNASAFKFTYNYCVLHIEVVNQT